MEEVNRRLTRKEKKLLRQQNCKEQYTQQEKLNFELKLIEPLTHNQKLTFDAYAEGKNLMLHGVAGTGKSFISLYLALNQILTENNSYKRVVIVRSAVPTREQGFVPGDSKMKNKVYELPYYDICSKLFKRGDAYEYLKNKHLLDFITTSFIRGITLDDSIVIVDEIANLTLHELDSVITRVGRNCRIIFCGDFRQSDFEREKDKNGLLNFMRIIEKMKAFSFIEFDYHDIVRSSLVKDYIITKDKLRII